MWVSLVFAQGFHRAEAGEGGADGRVAVVVHVAAAGDGDVDGLGHPGGGVAKAADGQRGRLALQVAADVAAGTGERNVKLGGISANGGITETADDQFEVLGAQPGHDDVAGAGEVDIGRGGFQFGKFNVAKTGQVEGECVAKYLIDADIAGAGEAGRQARAFKAVCVDVAEPRQCHCRKRLDGHFVDDGLAGVNVNTGLGADLQCAVLDLGGDVGQQVFVCLYGDRFGVAVADLHVANALQGNRVETADRALFGGHNSGTCHGLCVDGNAVIGDGARRKQQGKDTQ